MPSTRARSLPRPPGKHAQHRARDAPQRVGDRADHAVAAEHHDGLAGAGGLAGQLARMVEVARVARCDLEARPRSAARPPARRVAALPPPAEGLTIRQTGRSASSRRAYWRRAAETLEALGGVGQPAQAACWRGLAACRPTAAIIAEDGEHDEQPEQHAGRESRRRRTAARSARRCRGRSRAAR